MSTYAYMLPLNHAGLPQLLGDNGFLSVPINASVVTLECPYRAYPKARVVEWTKNQQLLQSDEIKYKIHLVNGGLQIFHLAFSDSGDYACRIGNSIGYSADQRRSMLQVIGEWLWLHSNVCCMYSSCILCGLAVVMATSILILTEKCIDE